MKQGAPDSKNVMNGKRKIKYHLDYMTYLLERRRWLAGNSMTLADFTAAAHFSTLDYTKDVDWVESNTVKDWYAKIKGKHVVFEFNGNHHYQSSFKILTDWRKHEVLSDPSRNHLKRKS